MALRDNVKNILSSMILSHSGWRGIFAASGDEESKTEEISAAHKIIIAGAAAVFSEYFNKPSVLVGCDTRPTGKAIAEVLIRALEASGCPVRYAGITAAPEIAAWARTMDSNTGFIYITASHNPVGHNGLKFGLTDGGVLSAEEASKLTVNFLSLMESPGGISRLEQLPANANSGAIREIYAGEAAAKKEALDAYFKFSMQTAFNSEGNKHAPAIPVGICCDFNGSARCVSIDRAFFAGLNIQFAALNAIPGDIVHCIVPEGNSLEPCRLFLEEMHSRDPVFVMGYVPDCDGDRGNLVIWDDTLQKARVLEAQEVFALACASELAFMKQTEELTHCEIPPLKPAVAVNDPTSLRIDRIAGAFRAPVFRAEVGEANVVNLARKLRNEGYTVRILGEGSNGGNITHPSAMRDPLQTVLALVKFISLRSAEDKTGLFEIWCKASGYQYRPDFKLSDIIKSLPDFVTTAVHSPEAILKITSTDHCAIKRKYQKIFIHQWEERKSELAARYGIHRWEAAGYNGITEQKGIADFGTAGKGGLKICFFDTGDKTIASLWMRGSATEPVFRVMADAEGTDIQFERYLIEWQRSMVTEADRS